MLRIYDKAHNPTGYVKAYKDLKIESVVSTGDKTLSFTYMGKKEIETEFYIQTQTDEYVVKEKTQSLDGFPQFVAVLNIEELEAKPWNSFSAKDSTIDEAARLALAGTGWTIGECDVKKKRNAGMLQVTSRDIIEKLATAFMCEVTYDTKKKTVSFYNETGEDKGAYFIRGLNLKKLNRKSDSYDYYTQIIPIGENNLSIEKVNNGKNYLENYQYSDKVRAYIWKDESYTDAQALMEDAELKLQDLSKPIESYSVTVLDLAKQKKEYSVLSYHVGDKVWLIDSTTRTRVKQRIVKMTEYPLTPEKNTCEIANTILTFEELQQKYKEAAEIVNTVVSGDGRYTGTVNVSDILNFEQGLTNSAAISGALKSISGLNQDVKEIKLDVGSIQTNYLKTEDAKIKYATIDFSNIGEASIKNLFSKYGLIENLVLEDGYITGELVGVTIKGDLIEGGTVKADKLVVKGKDGIYYKLNIEGGEFKDGEEIPTDELHGSVIAAKSITAEKVSVSDLVAFGATIGGFKIGEKTIYSGMKESVSSPVSGIYIDSDGQLAVGNTQNFIKYYKDENGKYHLSIAAESITFGTSGASIEDALAKAITSGTEEFYQSNSPTNLTGGEWSTKEPTWTDGKYIWRRTKNTYGDGHTDYSPSENGVCITGNTGAKGDTGDKGEKGDKGETGAKGDTGASGKSIGAIINYYLATASASNVTTSTSGWTTTVQSVTASKKYLWNYEVIKYSDGTTASTSVPCIIGVYGDTGAKGDKGDTGAKGDTGSTGAKGDTGNGISGITEYYQVSASNTAAPASWVTTVPNMTSTNKYLWNYEKITYTNGSTKETNKRVIGVYGDKGATGAKGDTGATGAKGDKGDAGANGKGIASTSVTYQTAASQTTIPTGTWSDTLQEATSDKPYLWTKTVWTYTDGQTVTSYNVGVTADGIEIGGRNLLSQQKIVYYKNSAEYNNGFKNTVADTKTGFYPVLQFYDANSTLLQDFGKFTKDDITAIGKFSGTVTYTGKDSTVAKCRVKHSGGSQNVIVEYYDLDFSVKNGDVFTFSFNLVASNPSIVGGLLVDDIQVERGNKATDWTPAPEDVDKDIDNASKTATNYLNFDENGLVVGDMTASELGRNVHIDSDSVDIRNGEDVLASFAEDLIELGNNNRNATIRLLKGLLEIIANTDTNSLIGDQAVIASQGSLALELKGLSSNQYADIDLHKSVSTAFDGVIEVAAGISAGSGNTSGTARAHEHGSELHASDSSTADYAGVSTDVFDSSGQRCPNVLSHVTGANGDTEMRQFDNRWEIYKNGVLKASYNGENKTLWAGLYYMTASHTVTLSEAISEQPNGIVLAFSKYLSSDASNAYYWNMFFVPKSMVNLSSGRVMIFPMFETKFGNPGTKALYITDTTIKGNADNTSSGTSNGITYNNNNYVLRAVIGV